MRSSSIAALAAILAFPLADRPADHEGEAPPVRFNEATVADLQAQMAAGRLTSVELTRFYLKRIQDIDEDDHGLNSVIELNPDALAIAARADAERRREGAGAVARHPGPAQGQHRHRRPDADHRGLVRPGRRAAPCRTRRWRPSCARAAR